MKHPILLFALGAGAPALALGIAAPNAAADTTAVEARVELAYNLLMLQKGDDAEQVLDSIPGDSVPASVFINDVILRAANLLWTQQSPEESWQVIEDALAHATDE